LSDFLSKYAELYGGRVDEPDFQPTAADTEYARKVYALSENVGPHLRSPAIKRIVADARTIAEKILRRA